MFDVNWEKGNEMNQLLYIEVHFIGNTHVELLHA